MSSESMSSLDNQNKWKNTDDNNKRIFYSKKNICFVEKFFHDIQIINKKI